MSAGNLAALHIDIDLQLAKVRRELSQLKAELKKMADQGQKDLGRLPNLLIKGFAALSTVEIAARGVQSVTSLIRGDMDEVLRAIEQMPLGIGTVVRSLKEAHASAVSLVTSLLNASSRVGEIRRDNLGDVAGRRRTEGILNPAAALADRLERQVGVESSLAGLTGAKRQEQSLFIQLERRRAEIRRQLRDLESLRGVRGSQAPLQRSRLNKLLNQLDANFTKEVRGLNQGPGSTPGFARQINRRFDIVGGIGGLNPELAEQRKQTELLQRIANETANAGRLN